MDTNVPYMASVKNLTAIFGKIQKAAVPERFTIEFLKDLGFKSSNDFGVTKLLKYLGFLSASGQPQTAYREYVDETKSKKVLAQRIKIAFDDLYNSNKTAHTKTGDELKGWFKTKTGKSDSVAIKMATTFKTLASIADFSAPLKTEPKKVEPAPATENQPIQQPIPIVQDNSISRKSDFGLVYRFEIHLPDTQNIETHRAIFKALKEELLS
ncbi:DUF5343 domain-containing protein [Tenacibaculum sp. 1_MG-2023]|uniref:DUF5343 domain-containing protein n=1 Tax=Tenacibaculum sp. 1_MG-2023 TaxID=3062653 RepID=UPI0026E38D87|nr:DUF5343 domain-containing protein [Tenacibaculum sp. 1_MG-2023]MDO6674580.1 DUF5343 domain-containing protein [Tenacibaculum sp. 1_MG-2023]